MVQEPFQLHLPDQLSLGKCALGWKGAKERRGEKPGIQSFFIFYSSPTPTARRWWSSWSIDSKQEPSKPAMCMCRLAGLWGLHLQSVIHLLHAPACSIGHPLWSICAGLLFAYAGAGQVSGCRTQAAACLMATLPGNTECSSHRSYFKG